ncbi:hypothetical protein CARUB_v10025035mg [Capsella rubella]|uniref:RING-type domain-containing protein n=1 Tax=Capsella rubella TaxID=81985 RepID=R0HXI7_9BRAS|nr:RING finger protein 11 [Capsella rubella]EOA28803.1 hypothetical protein CARUB_v10025035mg [Capsella rubella]
MESGDVKIDIHINTEPLWETYSTLPSFTLNFGSIFSTVCINLSRRFKRFVIDKSDFVTDKSNVVTDKSEFVIDKSDRTITCTGFYPAPPPPTPQICLNLLDHEFSAFHIIPLINSRLHDLPSSIHIANAIEARAALSVGLLQPVFMTVDVVFTKKVISVSPGSCLADEENESTCSICLEDFCTGDDNSEWDIRELSQCSHRFHEACIRKWLMRCRSCPICRRAVQQKSH